MWITNFYTELLFYCNLIINWFLLQMGKTLKSNIALAYSQLCFIHKENNHYEFISFNIYTEYDLPEEIPYISRRDIICETGTSLSEIMRHLESLGYVSWRAIE
jgi:hypothetical protein